MQYFQCDLCSLIVKEEKCSEGKQILFDLNQSIYF